MRMHLLLVALLLCSCAAIAATLESSVEIICSSDLVSSTGLVGEARDNLRYRLYRYWSDGTGTGSADVVWHSSRTLASGASEDIDIRGSLTNAIGGAAVFARVYAMTVENVGTTTLVVGGHPTAAFDPTLAAISLIGSATLQLCAPTTAGWPTIAGASDTIRVTNGSGATGTYKIWLIGKSS